MPPALSPELALAYVRELAWDVRGAAVRDPAGAVLAGDELPPGDVVRVQEGRLEVAIVPGPRALAGLARHDAELAARALASDVDAP